MFAQTLAYGLFYILDLHGSSQPREKPPEGLANGNVFDIRKGVAIAFFVKLPKSHLDARGGNGAIVRHAELWGTGEEKLLWLDAHTKTNTDWKIVTPESPLYLFSRITHGGDIREFFFG